MIALIPVLSLVSFGQEVIGSGVRSNRTFNVPAFSRVSAGAAMHVTIRVGGNQTVRASGETNILAIMRLRVEHGELLVDFKQSFSSHMPIELEIGASSLDGLHLSGASIGKVTGVRSKAFDFTGSGASRTSIFGAFALRSAELSGASQLSAHGVRASSTRLVASGGSELTVLGRGGSVKVESSGGSRVDLSAFATEQATAEASGGSTISLHAKKATTASSGGATISNNGREVSGG